MTDPCNEQIDRWHGSFTMDTVTRAAPMHWTPIWIRLRNSVPRAVYGQVAARINRGLEAQTTSIRKVQR